MEKVKININGRDFEANADQTVLDVARANAIHIPALCHHPAVKDSGGACRVCLVETIADGKSRVAASCNMAVKDGMEIKTDTEAVVKIRKKMVEKLLTRAPGSELIRSLAAADGVEAAASPAPADGDKCIGCGLCALICEHVVGVKALTMEKKDGNNYPVPNDACIGCGACAFACNTQAIAMKDENGMRKIWNHDLKMVKCTVCGTPFIPEAQVNWIVKSTGKDRAFFEKCPDHR